MCILRSTHNKVIVPAVSEQDDCYVHNSPSVRFEGAKGVTFSFTVTEEEEKEDNDEGMDLT